MTVPFQRRVKKGAATAREARAGRGDLRRAKIPQCAPTGGRSARLRAQSIGQNSPSAALRRANGNRESKRTSFPVRVVRARFRSLSREFVASAASAPPLDCRSSAPISEARYFLRQSSNTPKVRRRGVVALGPPHTFTRTSASWSRVPCGSFRFFSIGPGREKGRRRSGHRIQRENRSSTCRRMGAWVDERFAEEEAVASNQSATWTWRIRSRDCNGGGPLHGRPGAGCQSPDNITSTWSSASLLPLRRQFTRQLYEWPCLPLFKSRTKLDLY